MYLWVTRLYSSFQNMMSVSQISTTVMKMLCASILSEDTTVFANQAIRGMEPRAKVKGFHASTSSFRNNVSYHYLPPPLLSTSCALSTHIENFAVWLKSSFRLHQWLISQIVQQLWLNIPWPNHSDFHLDSSSRSHPGHFVVWTQVHLLPVCLQLLNFNFSDPPFSFYLPVSF